MNRGKALLKAHLPIALCVLMCALAMLWVFHWLGKLNDSVIYGTVLGCTGALCNLFLLQLPLQYIGEEAAPKMMQTCRILRLVILLCVCYFGLNSSLFSAPAVIIPLTFPPIGALFLNKLAPLITFVKSNYFTKE